MIKRWRLPTFKHGVWTTQLGRAWAHLDPRSENKVWCYQRETKFSGTESLDVTAEVADLLLSCWQSHAYNWEWAAEKAAGSYRAAHPLADWRADLDRDGEWIYIMVPNARYLTPEILTALRYGYYVLRDYVERMEEL